MTERLADIGARVQGIRQLGAVVSAMRGIAAARAQQARRCIEAAETYLAILATAIGQAMDTAPPGEPAAGSPDRLAIVLFCAEQGFAGAFSERVLAAAEQDLLTAKLFLVGTRGMALAAERGLALTWSGVMPSQSAGMPKVANLIAEALYPRIASGEITLLDTIFTLEQPGGPAAIKRRRLFPLDPTAFIKPSGSRAPLLNLDSETLLTALTADYVHAQLCEASLQAFAAENVARMAAMASAHTEIERKLGALQSQARIVRQDEITAEIIELAAGDAASRVDA